jgi:isopentenyl diphosphate isomerase/L-lactate dehydrogenase-like FMN-dependent dehydrogenase
MAEKLTTSIAEYERRARGLLPADLFARWFGSREDPMWATNKNNEDGFDQVFLRPRVLQADPDVKLATDVLGGRIAFPVILAPAGAQARFHPDGELASAKASQKMDTAFVLSTGASYSIEEVRQVSVGLLWFQLYVFKDRELTRSLIERAEAAGYMAIVVTVDEPATRTNEREGASSLRVARQPAGMTSNVTPFGNLRGSGVDTEELIIEAMEPRLDWAVIDWIRSVTNLPIVIKGVQTAEDARVCVEHGIDGLVVSNHGGHALQGAYATILTLPEIADAVGGQIEIYLDGGIRRGTDVLKAVALGARAVMIGRAMYWGVAVGGEAGVAEVLNVLREELYLACIFCGVTDIEKTDASLVRLPPR